MKVGLVDVDSKIPNLALMKLSAWHKAQGDEVKMFDPLFDHPDIIYSSKVFTSTEQYHYFPSYCDVIQAGSGDDLKTKLPDHIESVCPDYSLYGINYAMGFATRGCIRECGFCIVPKKEGKLQAVSDIHQFWNGQRELMLLDNNITADSNHFEIICKQLIKHMVQTNFCQGLDIRLMDEVKAKLLNQVKRPEHNRIHFAWDSMDTEKEIITALETVIKFIKPYKIMFYVLIGWDTTEDEDLYRVEMLRSYGVDSFVMPYDKANEYQRKFARWVNMKAIFKTVAWTDYLKKGETYEKTDTQPTPSPTKPIHSSPNQ